VSYEPSSLQAALIALLPKSGQGVKVAELAKTAAITPQQVTDALFDLYMEKVIDFDVISDTYFLPSERKTT
jgi:chromosome segregation and condensation protein ScpB